MRSNKVQRRSKVIKKRRKRNLIPAWDMPSDPVKAVFWFLFWLPIIAMVIIETFLNWKSAGGATSGIVAGVVTLLVGLVIWAGLYVVTLFLNVGSTVSQVISDVNRAQQGFSSRRPLYPFNDTEAEKNVVEGTITDLEEERRKRRHE